MVLKDLIRKLELIDVIGDLTKDITDITYDSREVVNGSLFVAIVGFKTDGHKYINDAIEKGAKAVIVERDVQLDKNITVIKVNNSRKALAKVSSTFYDRPSSKINVIGVTGTNGKTSVTYLIKSIFDACKRKTGIIGTIGSVIENKVTSTNNTTPESLDLQSILNDMVNTGLDTCIMEVSSHSLELDRVAFCDFNVGIFTNLSVDHLDFHKSIENYLNAKAKLFYKTKNFNIINIDDKYGKKISSKIRKLDVPLLTYGTDSNADIIADNIVYSAEGVSFELITPKGEIDIKMNIPGLFSVYNGLAAAACGYAYNIELENIKEGLESVKGVKGRFEVVPTDKDFTVIIDYAHTPDGLEKVMETISQFAKGRKIIVFGAGGDRPRTRRPLMGEVAAKYSDLSIVTSDNPRTEEPNKIIEDIIEGIERLDGKYVAITDRKEAIRYALKNSQPNDVILLAGKGHEMYQIIGNKRIPFNEKEIVLEILKEIN
ncbi:UDP-N-acetylmuramoyl-L-alanyl-D-glutamate--2,6-diaminopimelate ligase [Caldisalinibacter kiritimatiensis]|uniref:UDP-N-acetylmuramoyl-L-alanyl-D-glutamate--2,6-diaminopimelate ligase n=1 Tax=Caldisalinibacter kiritimatiensis TaxID=1304284 RepID=R1AX55_9FIRM|nr:UDP-N-acetylmuramoyl-L-alanyl-D-glutamate--2,6-diaminopimelate ligase [Caldisalinibacter kiritimatiensis]EOD01257.1 UDP-N-acetylmuramoylalanyl-D-glutamate--2,6- diaminopimelate ligase [Caldisalinibacter kiritimatiensis]